MSEIFLGLNGSRFVQDWSKKGPSLTAGVYFALLALYVISALSEGVKRNARR